MKRAIYIQHEVEQVGTITNMTSIFEAIASIHISQIKDKVMSSTAFFNELWHIYTQLRLGEGDYVQHRKPKLTNRQALVVVTSEGGLIGDIDERIVEAMLEHPGHETADIFVIGAHGSGLLARRGVHAHKVFSLPEADSDINVTPVTKYIDQYAQATVYYQTYVSLLRQEVARIDLFSAVSALGTDTKAKRGEVISSRDYIFEPSLDEIISYMESVMLEIALGQIILESKLAQYASRFNAMSQAKSKAKEMQRDLQLALNRSKRAQGDERIKEVLGGMKIMARSKRG
jgi:F-type H+-transporting ATPase subunit gamma